MKTLTVEQASRCSGSMVLLGPHQLGGLSKGASCLKDPKHLMILGTSLMFPSLYGVDIVMEELFSLHITTVTKRTTVDELMRS